MLKLKEKEKSLYLKGRRLVNLFVLLNYLLICSLTLGDKIYDDV